MLICSQVSPATVVEVGKKVYRVESAVKVSVAKGTPFIKMKLRDLLTDEIIEKSFKVDQQIKEVSLEEHKLEYLYPEGKGYLFLDIDTLEQIPLIAPVLKDTIDFMKEGVQIKAFFYGENVFSVELPQFLELMVVKTEKIEDKMHVKQSTKQAILETGAKIEVPLFVETGDVIKIDTTTNEYVQRV